MKWTNSKDGILRSNITISFRISRAHLISVICSRLVQQGTLFDESGKLIIEDANQFTTRKSVVEMLKSEITYGGEDAVSYWSDEKSDSTFAAVEAHAEATITKLFPELN